MDDETLKLIEHIEELRAKMVKLAQEKSFTDPELITASRMLDAVLNEYNELLKRKANNK